MNPTHYMSLALRLAEQGRFTVSPNPMVGCVIVKDNQIVGQGYHQRAGGPHAEIHALNEAGMNAKDATAFVTLEPCCHHGRTPPCTDALIGAGIKKIYLSCIDPNPLVATKGIKTLRAAGIEVEVGCCERQAYELNEIFFHYINHKRPFVIAKWAMSLDGKTSVHLSDDKQISGAESQHHTHQLRHQVDAILVGARTACHDDPQLTVRLANPAKHPLRIILAGRHPLPAHLKVFNGQLPGKTLVATTQQIKNMECLIIPENKNKQISLPALLDELGKRNISSLLVEGGMTVHESFFKENLVNKVQVFLAPVFIGSLEKKRTMNVIDFAPMGKDFHFNVRS